MRIILIQPNYDAHIIHPPLGLGYLASFLIKNRHEVSIFDGTLKNASINDFLNAVTKFKADLVGISILTRGYKQVKEIIKKLKKEKKNLDSLPFPAWDLMPPKKYRIAPILQPAKGFPIAPILTSRGCPYNCSFCASNVTWQRIIRFRSPKNVIAEIKMLKKKFGVKEIHFCDDNFTMDIKRAAKICMLMIKHKINLPWQCPNGVRIDRLPLSLLYLMKKAGCYAVGLGIESGNQKILNKNSKQLDLKIVPRVLKNLKKVKIQSYGFFILGLPGDTLKTITQTINFSLNNPFNQAWFNLFTPYPGSEAFNQWLGKRSFDKIDWEQHDCSKAIVTIKGLSLKDLEKLQKKALLRFYLRPKILFLVISNLGIKEITTFLMSRFFSKLLKPIFLFTHRIIRKK